MRYIQIKLLEVSFWGLPDLDIFIHGNDISPIIDLKTLDKQSYDIIKESYRTRCIDIVDIEGNDIKSLYKQGSEDSTPDISDIEEEDNSTYDIVSVTVSDDEEKSEENKEIEPSIKDYEKADTILSKNGNTSRKIIKSLKNDLELIGLLKAIKELEIDNKNRKSILKEVDNKIGELNV